MFDPQTEIFSGTAEPKNDLQRASKQPQKVSFQRMTTNPKRQEELAEEIRTTFQMFYNVTSHEPFITHLATVLEHCGLTDSMLAQCHAAIQQYENDDKPKDTADAISRTIGNTSEVRHYREELRSQLLGLIYGTDPENIFADTTIFKATAHGPEVNTGLPYGEIITSDTSGSMSH